MKKYFIILGTLLLLGCSLNTDQLPSFLEDPHFAAYQKKQDELESLYLQKKISYDEYLTQKKKLDDKYAREVQHRQTVIEADPANINP